MTPRERFAGLFAAALLGLDNRMPESIARTAVVQADALIAELKRTSTPRTAPAPPMLCGRP